MLIFCIIRYFHLKRLFKNNYYDIYYDIRHYENYTVAAIEREKNCLAVAAEQALYYKTKKQNAPNNSFAKRYYTSCFVKTKNQINTSKQRLQQLDELTKIYEKNKDFYKKFVKVLDFSPRV